ncbi:MAG TPA: adenylate/guanylate cyclase domain-containing protein [Candidatus Binatia bacterium]|jgi:adenylate cyclase
MPIVETLKKRKRRFYKSLVLGLSVSIITSFASYMGYLQGFEAKALDFLLWLRGRVKSPEIVLVQIDDRAFANLGEKQPLPRSYIAGIIEVLGRSGAKVIGVDVEFKVKTDAREDAMLVRAIQGASENGLSKVVPVYVIRPEKEANETVLYSRSPFFSPKLSALAGFANAPIDSDGLFRQLPLAVHGSDGKVLPSLALAVLARYAGYDAARLEAAMNRPDGGKVMLLLPEWNKFKGALLPEPTPLAFAIDDQWKINFAGAEGSFAAIPSDVVFQLSKSRAPLAEDNPFRGKIVLIGASFGESRDFFPTPRGLMSGVEIHANIVHTILSRSQIMAADRWVAVALSLIFALAMSLLLTFFRPMAATIFALVAIPLLLVPLSYLAFAKLGVWVDFVTPLVAIRWGASIADYLEARRVRRSLGQYVDREVADQIVDQDETLGGQMREATIFFTDIRNYTTLSEGKRPEEVVSILNELFATIGKVVARHQGCIVDFIGDAVLAAFGAHKPNPSHAADAVATALEVQAELDRLNKAWHKRDIPHLQIGVGIHSGEVLAGIVGSGQRRKFGVTGDTVNTGSRVEALNKEFSTSILITRETLERLNGKFKVEGRGEVKVKGRDKPVEVFEVLGAESAA